MQEKTEPIKKEFIVKRISASQFEVYDGSQLENKEKEKPAEKCQEQLVPRQTVIRRAPPAAKAVEVKKRRIEGPSSSNGVILIRDAIMFRIVDILMFKVIGENQLKVFGYPFAATYQVLWKVLCQDATRSGIKKPETLHEDHDCGGNVVCFAQHVRKFLEFCAPELLKSAAWAKLSTEEILRKIYHEDLIPYLRSIDLRNNINVLQCHSDIVLLEKWEKQKFTAVTWTGQKYFSQVSINCPKCPQCSNRHF